MEIKSFAKRVHELAKSKGWWERNPESEGRIAECLLNIHSEVSEASEAARDGKYNIWYDKSKGNKPEGMVVELADIIIRILDTCQAYGLDIEQALIEKAKYNETRPYRHGGKKF